VPTSFRRLSSEPISDLSLLQREINRLFEKLAEFDRANRPQGVEWLPSIDVFDCKGNLVVVIEVPGLQADSLKIIAREGTLLVSGERRDRSPSGVGAFHCMSRPHGRFTRGTAVARALDIRNAQARLERGLLTITIPRLKDRRGRETVIPVERVE